MVSPVHICFPHTPCNAFYQIIIGLNNTSRHCLFAFALSDSADNSSNQPAPSIHPFREYCIHAAGTAFSTGLKSIGMHTFDIPLFIILICVYSIYKPQPQGDLLSHLNHALVISRPIQTYYNRIIKIMTRNNKESISSIRHLKRMKSPQVLIPAPCNKLQ